MVGALLLSASLGTVRGGDAGVDVQFDFGDGTITWVHISLGTNRTAINATIAAARTAGLHVSYSWNSSGAFVDGIGSYHAGSSGYWHLFTWNGSSSAWDYWPHSASSLNLADGDSIVWYLAIDNPRDHAKPVPSATPPNPYPSIMFRQDLSNSGRQRGSLCTDLEQVWEYNTSAILTGGTPAAAGGRLLVPTWQGFSALSQDTGSLLWKRDDLSGTSSPAVYDQGVFVGASDGKLHRLAISNGREAWNTTLTAQPGFTGIASSPKPYKDRVFVGIFNDSGGLGGVAALNIWNGTVIWRNDAPSVYTSSPAILDDSLFVGIAGYFNSTSYTFSKPYGLLALNATDGSRRWFFQVDGSVASSPLIIGSSVFFTSRDGLLHAVGTNGTVLWTKAISPSTSSPATDGQRLFVADGLLGGTGHVTAFSPAGALLWQKALPGPVQASPLYVDGVVLVVTNAGNGTVYALDRSTGGILWSFLPDQPYFMLSSPVVADGRVFTVADGGMVRAFDCRPPPAEATFTYAMLVVIPIVVTVALAVIVYVVWRRRK